MRTLWCGPVSMAVAQRASEGDVSLVQCTGDGSDGGPTCGVRSGTDMQGESFEVLCAFSAGGSFLKRRPDLLRNAKVLYLADATYTTTNGAQEAAFAEFASRAKQRSGVLFVASASTFANKDFPNGDETLHMIEDAIGGAGGDAHFIYRGTEIKHAEHATKLAPEMFDSIVRPWLFGGVTSPNGGEDEGSAPFGWRCSAQSCWDGD